MYSSRRPEPPKEAEMNEKKQNKVSHWWVAILAFLAGMAFYAGASAPRSQAQMTASPASVSTPAAETGGHSADANSDTCDVQLD
jgi:hypothetical protein